jgi:hypothetical protein
MTTTVGRAKCRLRRHFGLWLAHYDFAHDSSGSPSCYDSAMRNLIVLFIRLIAALVRLFGPGGVGSLVAESLLLKQQLQIVNRSRQRSPNLSGWDRILVGWMALLVRPTRCSVPQFYRSPQHC